MQLRLGVGWECQQGSRSPYPSIWCVPPCCSPIYMPVNLFQRQQILPGSHITPPLRLSGAFCCFNITIAFSVLFLWVMQMMVMPSLTACFGIRMGVSKFASQHHFFFFSPVPLWVINCEKKCLFLLLKHSFPCSLALVADQNRILMAK